MAMDPSAAVQALEDVRKSVTYHASLWGDNFLSYEEISSSEKEELEKLKEEVRKLLATTPDHLLQKLELIDTIQRLGVGYHFEKEIEECCKNVYHAYLAGNIKDENSLHVVALRFRLLRQYGYKISADVFNKFINKEGKFKESLANNVVGLLSLYEASHYGVHGEEILHVALEFSSSHLHGMVSQIGNASVAEQVREALENPIHKSLTRLQAQKFIPIYQADESHSELLLTFAKIDFNYVQKVHQKEMCDLMRWWKGLNFREKLPFARDRMVECYFWIVEIYVEPQFGIARIILAKMIMLATVIDDIYDVHGTMDELKLFTDAMESFDTTAMEQLPPYMAACYEALLHVFEDIKQLEKLEDGSYRESFAKEEMKKLVRVHFKEATRLFKGQIPTLEEYLEVGLPSVGYQMVAMTSLVGMGDLAVKQDFDWISKDPLIIRAGSLICRLMNDMAGYKFEQKVSSVRLYKDEKCVTTAEALIELEKLVQLAWKDINQECLHPTPASMTILRRLVNSVLVLRHSYRDDDGFTNSKTWMKEAIQSVLVQPMAI